MSALFTALQVVLALVSVYFLYRLALWILFTDRIVTNDKGLVSEFASTVKLVDGVVDLKTTNNISYNTGNRTSDNYALMPVSVNRKGGAQFSYSFWLYATDVHAAMPPDGELVLFLKGINDKFAINKGTSQVTGGTRIVCPRVYLKSMDHGRPQLCIDYNVLRTPVHQTFVVDPVRNPDDTKRHNLMSLLPNNWVMITIVFMDNVPSQDFEDGMLIKVYVNDLLYDTKVDAKTGVRQNAGNFYVAPNAKAGTSTRLSDLVYCNYAMSDADIVRRYTRGPNLKAYAPNIQRNNNTLQLSEYNKLDIYNA